MQHCGGGGGSVLPLRRRLPEDNTVLTGLGEGQLPEPADTVHVVAMDVSRGEYREVRRKGGKTPMWVGGSISL